LLQQRSVSEQRQRPEQPQHLVGCLLQAVERSNGLQPELTNLRGVSSTATNAWRVVAQEEAAANACRASRPRLPASHCQVTGLVGHPVGDNCFGQAAGHLAVSTSMPVALPHGACEGRPCSRRARVRDAALWSARAPGCSGQRLFDWPKLQIFELEFKISKNKS